MVALPTRKDLSTSPHDDSHLLIEKARVGEPGARDALIDRYLPDIRAYVRLNADSVIRARESCSDLVQTVCKDVLGNLEEFDYRGENTFKAWLFTAVCNKIRSRHRYYGARKRDIARERPIRGTAGDADLLAAYGNLPSPSRDAVAREEIARIETAFDRLPEHYREVLALSRLAGLRTAEIAVQMGRTVPSVQSLLGRAIAQLTTVLDRMTHGESGRA